MTATKLKSATPPSSSMLNSDALSTITNYNIIEEIGRGGMATVYKAWQPSLSRTVALKVLPPYFAHDEELVIRFRREAHAVAKLRHSHIVQVFDFHQEEQFFYLAMEYIGGGSLQSKLEKHGRLAPSEATKIIRQVAEGLHHAHTKGFIHRDIKPSNILISEDGDAVITDFGIVKALKSTKLTKTSDGGIGTSEYMSPEQAKGEKVDPTTDLYSLGVVLYESLIGTTPFNGESALGVANRHINDKPARPSELNDKITPEQDEVILKLLSKKPTDRYSSALELVGVLNSLEFAAADNIEAPGSPHKSGPKATLIRRVTRVAARLPRLEKPPRKSQEAKDDSQTKKTGRLKISWSSAIAALLIIGLAGIVGFLGGYLVFPAPAPVLTVDRVEPKEDTTSQVKKATVAKTPTLNGVKVTPAEALINVDETLTLEAQGLFSDGSRKDVAILWSLSDSSIAGINDDGQLKATKAGTITVEAKAGEFFGTARIEIVEKPEESSEESAAPVAEPVVAPVKRYRPRPLQKPAPEPAPVLPEPAPSIPLEIN